MAATQDSLPPEVLQHLQSLRDELPDADATQITPAAEPTVLLPQSGADVAAASGSAAPADIGSAGSALGEAGGEAATGGGLAGDIAAAAPAAADLTGSALGGLASVPIGLAAANTASAAVQPGAAGNEAEEIGLPKVAKFLNKLEEKAGDLGISITDMLSDLASGNGGVKLYDALHAEDKNADWTGDTVPPQPPSPGPTSTVPAAVQPGSTLPPEVARHLASIGGGGGSKDEGEDKEVETPEGAKVTSENPMLTKYLQDRMDMLNAQKASNQNQGFAALAQAAAQTGHAISGTNVPLDQSVFNTLQANANAPVTNLQNQQKYHAQNVQNQMTEMQAQAMQEANDPNSTLSKNVNKMYSGIMKQVGLDPSVIDGMSASNTKAYVQSLFEHADAQATKKAIMQQNLMLQRERMDIAQSNKENGYMGQTIQALTSARGDPEVGQALKNKLSIQNTWSLLNQYKDPNQMSQQELQLAVQEMVKVATNGVPGAAEVNALMPNTWQGNLKVLASKATNQPTAANAGAFIDRYKTYLKELDKNSTDAINSKFEKIIDSNSGRIGQDNATALKKTWKRDYIPTQDSSGNASTGTVKMKDPQGNIRLVPANKKDAAIAAGGTLVTE